MTTLSIKNSISRPPLRRGFLLISLALASFALSPTARAVCLQGCGTNANTFLGDNALFSLTIGTDNTAVGSNALEFNTTGNSNTANGSDALVSNTIGNDNTATGDSALFKNTTGSENTAGGSDALLNNTTGSSNIALGNSAGSNLTTGSNNIDIGNAGVAGESNKIRIGTKGTQKATFIAGISGVTVAGGVGVIIDTNGHLGTVVSSERFKDGIKPMDKASEAILALQPVTFRYKHELDPDGIPQFGLIAEQVAKVNPALVARDDQGKPYTVRYEAVNAMLLNEFLKEHRKVEELEATVAKLQSAFKAQQATIAQQEKEIQALTASLKAQASQIQKVSDQLEVSKPAPNLVASNP
jgi:Chaperone of endosialidase